MAFVIITFRYRWFYDIFRTIMTLMALRKRYIFFNLKWLKRNVFMKTAINNIIRGFHRWDNQIRLTLLTEY